MVWGYQMIENYDMCYFDTLVLIDACRGLRCPVARLVTVRRSVLITRLRCTFVSCCQHRMLVLRYDMDNGKS